MAEARLVKFCVHVVGLQILESQSYLSNGLIHIQFGDVLIDTKEEY